MNNNEIVEIAQWLAFAKGDLPGHEFHGNQFTTVYAHGSIEERNDAVTKLSSELHQPAEYVNKIATASQPVIERLRKAEPDITKAVEAVIAASGGERAREGYAVKTLKSTTEKVIKETQGIKNISAAGVERRLDRIHDIIRYTITWKDKDIVRGAQAAIDEFKKMGYQPLVEDGSVKIKNFFHNLDPDNSYRGINCNFVDPKTGIAFEVQFHTPKSLEVAEINHPYYDTVRKLPARSEARQNLHKQMCDLARTVPIPRGIDTIGTLKVKKEAWQDSPAELEWLNA